jgi:hypothetical protein
MTVLRTWWRRVFTRRRPPQPAPPVQAVIRDADGAVLAWRREMTRDELRAMARERDEREADAWRAGAWLTRRRREERRR